MRTSSGGSGWMRRRANGMWRPCACTTGAERGPTSAPGRRRRAAMRRAVLDAMQEGMMLIGATGEVIIWNPSALRILDLPGDATADDVQMVIRRLRDEHAGDDQPNRLTAEGGTRLADITLTTAGPEGT